MISVEQGLQIMRPRIEAQDRHAHYDRTVDRRRLYHAMMTGDGLAEYLLRFESRENNEQFDLRKKITNQCVTPPINEAASKFYKTSRYPNIKKDLYYNTAAKNIDRLKEALNRFTYEGDIQSYIASEYDRRSLIDPNSFLIMDFRAFDAMQNEVPDTYGVFVPCDDVVDFEYLPNDELNYLIITRAYSFYDEKGIIQTVTDYYGYLGNDILIFEEYHEEREHNKDAVMDKLGTNGYMVYSLQPKAGQVQAFRLGYIKDPITHYKTVVSPLDNAETVVRDLNNDKSEYDQTKRFHVFPQKLQYVDDCPGEAVDSVLIGCRNGYNSITGAVCKSCGGTGLKPIHFGSSDVLLYKMPKYKDETQSTIKLSEMIHYAKPDIEIIEHLANEIEKEKLSIIRAIFTTQSAVKPDGEVKIESTATEFLIKNDDLNNILLPFCQHKVKFYKFVIRQIALFNDIADDLVIVFEYPESLRMESVEELQAKFALLVSSGVTPALLNKAEDAIAVKMYIDDTDSLNRYEIWNTHRPFRNWKESDINLAIGNGSVPKHVEILWANFEYIQGIFEDDPAFFGKKFAERAKLIRAEAEKLVGELDPEPTQVGIGGVKEITE